MCEARWRGSRPLPSWGFQRGAKLPLARKAECVARSVGLPEARSGSQPFTCINEIPVSPVRFTKERWSKDMADNEVKMTDTTTAQTSDSDRDVMAALTVRFGKDAYEAIESVAREFNTSKADVVRRTVDGKLADFLGQVKYIDCEQGERIERNIANVGTVLSDICNQLRRIGVLYNQDVRAKNIHLKTAELEAKKAECLQSTPIFMDGFIMYSKELDNLKKYADELIKDDTLLNKKELEQLMRTYADTARKVGDILCLIRE